jgi:hypothetical protein
MRFGVSQRKIKMKKEGNERHFGMKHFLLFIQKFLIQEESQNDTDNYDRRLSRIGRL